MIINGKKKTIYHDDEKKAFTVELKSIEEDSLSVNCEVLVKSHKEYKVKLFFYMQYKSDKRTCLKLINVQTNDLYVSVG